MLFALAALLNNFSNVSFIVILYRKFSIGLIFEKFEQRRMMLFALASLLVPVLSL